MATTELGAWWRSGAALKYAFHKMQKSPWVWMCVQASPPMVVAYVATFVISRGKCSLGVSCLSMVTVLLSVVLHLWLRVRGRRQAAAHVTCAGLLTFEIIWLCELLLMEVDDLRRWTWNTQDSAAIIALGLFATGTWIGSQRGHLSREVYAGTIGSSRLDEIRSDAITGLSRTPACSIPSVVAGGTAKLAAEAGGTPTVLITRLLAMLHPRCTIRNPGAYIRPALQTPACIKPMAAQATLSGGVWQSVAPRRVSGPGNPPAAGGARRPVTCVQAQQASCNASEAGCASALSG